MASQPIALEISEFTASDVAPGRALRSRRWIPHPIRDIVSRLGRLAGQATRFGLVGLSGLALALGVLNLVMMIGRAFMLANVIAFIIAATWNFFLNRRVTFAPTNRPLVRQWLEFLAGSLATAAVNWLIAGVLYYQIDFFHTHYNAAALIGTAIAGGANFTWAKVCVFRPRHSPVIAS